MVLVVLGIDALDPELVDPEDHPNLVLNAHSSIETISSSAGEPSTHELWPTIITGLSPDEHGLTLNDGGVSWGSPILAAGSTVADYIMPDSLQSRIGAWLLTNTKADAFRTPASYYAENSIETVFDGFESVAIGVPNYVINSGTEDREHNLRRSLGDLFERDPDAIGGHRSADPYEFYEQCLEMVMVRIARCRRSLRGGRHELVFAYTSGLDLVGHVTYDLPDLQRAAYDEINEFVSELLDDLTADDELLIVSDHGLQNGVHTDKAMVASNNETMIEAIDSVLDVRSAVESALRGGRHQAEHKSNEFTLSETDATEVQEQLENLGYI